MSVTSKILTKEELAQHLDKYFTEHFGSKDSVEWFETTAVNVWYFKKNGKFYALKSHILTGEVEEHVEG